MVIKCVASIYDIYYKMVEERIQRERRRKILKTKKKNPDKNKYKYFLDKENDFQGKDGFDNHKYICVQNILQRTPRRRKEQIFSISTKQTRWNVQFWCGSLQFS